MCSGWLPRRQPWDGISAQFLVDEDARQQFEQSWSGQSAREHTPVSAGLRRPAISWRRWRNWSRSIWNWPGSWAKQPDSIQPASVEAYLDTYAELREGKTLGRLVRQEYRVRLAAGDTAPADDYTHRFPAVFPSREPSLPALQESRSHLTSPRSSMRRAARRPWMGSARSWTVGRVAMVGSHVGDFEILQELGRGGMGVVYRARDEKLGRDVALKMILGGAHVSSAQLATIPGGGAAAAHLQHTNIVQVYEIGEHEGLPFLALEFVPGYTLASQSGRQAAAAQGAAALVETLARTIQYAHERHILHRDLKPANILVTADGVPKISDFGLAKQLEGRHCGHPDGTVLGTPSYMSPEQAREQAKRSGRHGSVLAGDHPVRDAHRSPAFPGRRLRRDDSRSDPTTNPCPLASLQPTVPVDLDTICLKALQKEPDKRYASAADLAEESAALSRGRTDSGPAHRPLERGWRWCRRNPLVASLSAASLLLLLATTAVSAWSAITFAAKNRAIDSQNQELVEPEPRRLRYRIRRSLKQNEQIKLESENSLQRQADTRQRPSEDGHDGLPDPDYRGPRTRSPIHRRRRTSRWRCSRLLQRGWNACLPRWARQRRRIRHWLLR